MRQLFQDLRYSARSLAKSWGFTSVAVGTLALGIGATCTVFSVANILLFQPLNGGTSPDNDLVRVYSHKKVESRSFWRRFSYPNFKDLRAHRDLFQDLAAETIEAVGVGEGERTQRVLARFVTSDYLPMLNVSMSRGRRFTAADDEPGAPPVVIVSHAYWTSTGSDPALVGKTLTVNGRRCTVIGIAPPNLTGTVVLVAPPLWLPIGQLDGFSFLSSSGSRRRAALLDRDNHQLDVAGRLAPGVTLQSAVARLRAVSAAMEQAYPTENQGQSLVIARNSRTGSTNAGPATGSDALSTMVFFAMAMAIALLLVASLNLANMLLARGGMRQREIAVRLAMGAGRWRVVRLLLVEASLLALAGGAAGIWIAFGASQLIASMVKSLVPMADIVFDAVPDARVLAAALTFCAFGAAVFGLGPALSLSRADLVGSLKEWAGSQSGGRAGRIMRQGLVAGQIALSLALLTAGGLFFYGALRAASADPGFKLERGLVARLDTTLAGYDEPHTRQAYARVLDRLRSTPGVVSASLAHTTPYGERNFDRAVQPAGAPDDAPLVSAQYRVIGADYFRTLGVALLRGREFTQAEEASPAPGHPVVIDTELARRLWPGEDAIGRRIQWARAVQGGLLSQTCEVVGVVASLKVKLFDRSPRPHVYVPTGDNYHPALLVHVRIGSADERAEAAMLRTVGDTIRATDPGLPVVGLQTLRQVRDSGFESWFVTLAARVFAVLGGLALVVAAVGLYAVRAFLVGRRTREFGIRFAIGATAGDVLRLVMAEGAKLIAAGLSVGLLLSAGISRLVSGWVYGVRAFEPVVFVATALLLTGAMLLACYVPARRAIAVPPAVALRNE